MKADWINGMYSGRIEWMHCNSLKRELLYSPAPLLPLLFSDVRLFARSYAGSLINYSISSYRRPNFNYRIEPTVFVNRSSRKREGLIAEQRAGFCRTAGIYHQYWPCPRRSILDSIRPCLTFTLIYLQLRLTDLRWNYIVGSDDDASMHPTNTRQLTLQTSPNSERFHF